MTINNLALRPNCLLTRSPLVFLSGPRSIFSPQKMANQLQEFVQAHGYQVAPLWMPFRGDTARKAALSHWLQKNKTKSFHFFMAENTWRELQETLENNFHPFSTLTVVGLQDDTPKSHIENVELLSFEVKPTSPSVSYQLHQLFCKAMGSKAVPYEQVLHIKDPTLFDRFLDHCIELAENEYKDLTSRM